MARFKYFPGNAHAQAARGAALYEQDAEQSRKAKHSLRQIAEHHTSARFKHEEAAGHAKKMGRGYEHLVTRHKEAAAKHASKSAHLRAGAAHQAVLPSSGSAPNKRPESPKGPTLRGPKGGAYRLINGRKVYLGKDGK